MSDTIYDATQQTAGTLAKSHEKIIRVKRDGVFENITGDANNLGAVPTAVITPRENYGNKGMPSIEKLGDSWVVTVDVEAVRDSNGVIIQTWLSNLVTIAQASGADNKVELQVFDGRDENLKAIEGSFSVATADLSAVSTGYQDKGAYRFIFTSDGVVDLVTSPIAGTGEPIIESATPTLQTVGDQIVLRGYKFTGTTGVTIDTQAVTEFLAGPEGGLDDYTLVMVIPATVTGAADIIVTNATGASAAFAYTAQTV
ncbi:hypothetical protein GCM10022239_03370 [Leifsonia bigeumensis]|uniref:IPT/TIG domain-containing protein n=1 Tax=Leifsonella bigeumensis TaxID=433643 RepID=A0ABP7F5L5_9MICO